MDSLSVLAHQTEHAFLPLQFLVPWPAMRTGLHHADNTCLQGSAGTGCHVLTSADVTKCCVHAAVDPFGRMPLMSNDEIDSQYKAIYTNARSKSSSAELNLGMVTILVMIGLGIVFGLPYLVAQNRRRRRAGAAGANTQPQGGFM